MARRRYTIDEKRAAKFEKEGRGQGDGGDYKPWLTVRDVPSHGLSHRLMGITTGRQHDFLSNLEHDLFLLLDWQTTTADLREQYPLDIDATQDIAERLNIRHPQAPRTPQPMVMTTDLMLDRRGANGLETLAYAVKTAEDLEKPRTLHKLEIEWRYWQARNVPWSIVTRAELPRRLVDNITLVHGFYSQQGLDERALALIPVLLDEIATRPHQSIGAFRAAMDQQHNLPQGATWSILRHLLATQMVVCDMEQVMLNDRLPLAAMSVNRPRQRRDRA